MPVHKDGLKPTVPLFLIALLAGCGGPAPKKEEKAAAPAPAAVRITQFYAGEAEIGRGGRTLLCYGVENAASVRLEPPVEEISPSLNRCIEVRPARTTTYQLIAEGGGGTARASFTVNVSAKAAAPPSAKPAASTSLITRFTQEKKPGMVLLCYEADSAEAVSIEPGALTRTSAVRGCFGVAPRQRTTYTLVAYGPKGRIERRSLDVQPAP